MWMRKANAELDGSTPSPPFPAAFLALRAEHLRGDVSCSATKIRCACGPAGGSRAGAGAGSSAEHGRACRPSGRRTQRPLCAPKAQVRLVAFCRNGVVAADAARARHEWYQTESHVILAILMKKLSQEACDMEFDTCAPSIGGPGRARAASQRDRCALQAYAGHQPAAPWRRVGVPVHAVRTAGPSLPLPLPAPWLTRWPLAGTWRELLSRSDRVPR